MEELDVGEKKRHIFEVNFVNQKLIPLNMINTTKTLAIRECTWDKFLKIKKM